MFYQIFNQLVQDKGLFLYKISKETNIPKSIVYEWASGKREPVSEYIIILADYLDISIDYLLGRTEKQSNTYYSNNINNMNDSSVIQGSNSGSISIKNIEHKSKETQQNDLSKEETEILNIYRSLDVRNRTKFMNFVFEMEDKTTKS